MAHGNVTVPPLAPATPVSSPEIVEVLDFDTGEFLEVKALIQRQRYQDIVVARGEIRERMGANRPKYLCAMCNVAVYLVSTSEKRFFFRHRVEDGSCPAQTRSPLTYDQILARKYNGQKESEPHHRIKGLIERSLLADPDFTDVAVERTWHSSHDPKLLRRPDVQATFRKQKLAIEVQLSTTFLSVVVGRRVFYRDEGALLAWVLGNFDPGYRRLTTDDLLFSNNSNIFVVDEETAQRSIDGGRFVLKCHFRRPVRQGQLITDEWASTITPFDELTLDPTRQRLFLFDYDSAERSLHAEVAQEAMERENKRDWRLREAFAEFWCSDKSGIRWREIEEKWAELREAFSHRGLALPEYYSQDCDLYPMLNALYSAREGYPIGWNFKKLVEVAHHLAAAHPRQLLAFGYAIRQNDRSNQIDCEDNTGRWASKRQSFAPRLRAHDPNYAPDKTLLPLMQFLFPEVGEQVWGYIQRGES